MAGIVGCLFLGKIEDNFGSEKIVIVVYNFVNVHNFNALLYK